MLEQNEHPEAELRKYKKEVWIHRVCFVFHLSLCWLCAEAREDRKQAEALYTCAKTILANAEKKSKALQEAGWSQQLVFLFVARRIWAGRDEGEAARKRLTLEGLDKKNQIIKEAQVCCFKFVIGFFVFVTIQAEEAARKAAQDA